MSLPHATLPNAEHATQPHSLIVADQLRDLAGKQPTALLQELTSSLHGLSTAEADARAKRYGLNEIAREKAQSPLMRLLDNVKNPLVILLTALGILSYFTGDLRATVVIFIMVLLGIVLRFYQELRADNAAAKLKAMVNTTAHDRDSEPFEWGACNGP